VGGGLGERGCWEGVGLMIMKKTTMTETCVQELLYDQRWTFMYSSIRTDYKDTLAVNLTPKSNTL
jgi:hypothetical protein